MRLRLAACAMVLSCTFSYNNAKHPCAFLFCRHGSATLVCRRWQHLANSAPHLLRIVSVQFRTGDKRAAARLGSFCAWLLTHTAQLVQGLNLEVEAAKGGAPAGTSEQLAAALAATLVGCGMAGGLTALRLRASTALPFGWESSLHSLRRLTVLTKAEVPLLWHPPSSALPALQELALVGDPLNLPPSARLPPSLTKLHLKSVATDTLPPQVTLMCRLLHRAAQLRSRCATPP